MKGFSRKVQAGTTLIELVCVLSAVAIIAVFASRSVSAGIYAARNSSGLSSLMASLVTARNAAANGEIDVVLCPSADGETCAFRLPLGRRLDRVSGDPDRKQSSIR